MVALGIAMVLRNGSGGEQHDEHYQVCSSGLVRSGLDC